MGYSDFPFNIEQIALDLLNLKERHRGAVSFDVDCPFCGRRGKMNINIPKNTYRCNFCDDGSKGSKSSGGMLDLYANVLGGMNLSEAYREICEQLGVAGYSSGQQRTPRELWIREPSKKPPDIPQSEPAPPDVRHRTYSYLFSLLTLNPQHKESLLRRGLTEEQIRHYGYKSTPVLGFTRLAAAVMEHGCTVAGVPGFYVNTSGEWTTNFQAKCPGFLVPVRDMNRPYSGGANPPGSPRRHVQIHLVLQQRARAGDRFRQPGSFCRGSARQNDHLHGRRPQGDDHPLSDWRNADLQRRGRPVGKHHQIVPSVESKRRGGNPVGLRYGLGEQRARAARLRKNPERGQGVWLPRQTKAVGSGKQGD